MRGNKVFEEATGTDLETPHQVRELEAVLTPLPQTPPTQGTELYPESGKGSPSPAETRRQSTCWGQCEESKLGLTGVEGVALLWLWVPEALQPIVRDLEYKSPIYYAVG